jgi:hypothetical protein
MKEFFKNNWITAYAGLDKVTCTVGPASYFDDSANITISPTFLLPFIGIWFTGLTFWSFLWLPLLVWGYGKFYIDLPIHSGIEECDPPRYGFYWFSHGKWWHLNAFVLCKRLKTKHYYMPWSWEWVRTSKMKQDGTWLHDKYKGTRVNFYDRVIEEQIWSETYPYTYVCKDGEVQQRLATIKVEEREWRWRWFTWFPFIRKVSRDISVDFSYGGITPREILIEKVGHPLKHKQSGEVGESAGSWKGGTLGCGYKMKPGESPLNTLRRMEKEREFR